MRNGCEWLVFPIGFHPNIPRSRLKANTPKSGNAVEDNIVFPGAGFKEKTVGLYAIRIALQKQTFLDRHFFRDRPDVPTLHVGGYLR